MAAGLYTKTIEILIRVAILRANFKIDRESAEIIASIAKLILLRLNSNGPDYHEIAELAADLNEAIKEAQTSANGGIYS
jgi:uncharacterized protein YigE (DUF2233 family)